MLRKLIHIAKKAYTGSLGDGVSYERDKKIQAKGSQLESDIARICKKRGMFVLQNVYLPYGKQGKTMELDVVALDTTGLYLFESKNYTNCTITGNKSDTNWGVTYNSGKIFQLYNPLKQNENKVRFIAKALGGSNFIHSVAIFSDSCNIRVEMDRHQNGSITTIGNLPRFLGSKSDKLTSRDVKLIQDWLKNINKRGLFTGLQHERNVIASKKRR